MDQNFTADSHTLLKPSSECEDVTSQERDSSDSMNDFNKLSRLVEAKDSVVRSGTGRHSGSGSGSGIDNSLLIGSDTTEGEGVVDAKNAATHE